MIRLWLDDERDPTDPIIKRRYGARGDEVWVKTVDEAISHIQTGNVASVSLDHDLGFTDDKTGYDLAKWIEENAYYGRIQPFQWVIHSANPTGRENIRQALKNADRFWNR